MPKIGDLLRLNLQLWDGAASKYVRAYLYDSSDALIATVDLDHVGNGLYSDSSLVMPNTDQVRAVYRVFNDSGRTVVSATHSDSLDLFSLGDGSAGAGLAADLIGLINGDGL